MNLYRDTRSFFQWLGEILSVFIKARPFTTIALIVTHGVARICSILAFFLPLKVILLAGSPGVPRYFRFFVNPDYRMEWIVGLSVAAVAFYLLTHVLEVVSKNLSRSGSEEIVQDANEIAVVKQQRDKAQGYYSQFSSLTSNLLFGLLFLCLISLLNPYLSGTAVGLIASQFLFTHLVLYASNGHSPGRVAGFILNSTKDYLTILSAIIFFAGFAVIIYPYLVGDGPNILLSILSFLLLRQGITSFSTTISDSIDVYRSQLTINALVFRDKQIEKQEARLSRTLRALFSKDQRERRVAHELRSVLSGEKGVSVEWEDSSIGNVSTFHVLLHSSEESKPDHLQMQVFPEKELNRLENEEFLFQHVARDHLLAPNLISRFDTSPFSAQICEYGKGSRLKPADFKKVEPEIRANIWSISPPSSLVDAFKASRRLIHQRLTKDYIERMEVAVDRQSDEETYINMLARLPEIQSSLEGMPLYVFNPDLKPGNVVEKKSGGYFVMTWGKWALEPIGVALPRFIKDSVLQELVDALRRSRKDVPNWISVSHLRLANASWNLDKLIGQGKYRESLRLSYKILSNPCLDAAE